MSRVTVVAKVVAMLAFSEACERNKAPLLEYLQDLLATAGTALEVGSGTGQHAVYFARNLPHLVWQPSDQAAYLADLRERLCHEGSGNVNEPLALDVRDDPWPAVSADAVFSANTLHIMSWACVDDFFRGVGRTLQPRGRLIVYGPFRYDGAHTSDSNRRFDLQLRQRDSLSGIRDIEAVHDRAAAQGLSLLHDFAMPANNRLLVWQMDD